MKKRDAGSIPAANTGLVAQLVRAPACHAGGRRFESYKISSEVFSSVGRARKIIL